MVAMKTSVSKMVRWAHTATAEITTKIEDTTTSRTAIHLRGTDLSVVVSFAVVKVSIRRPSRCPGHEPSAPR